MKTNFKNNFLKQYFHIILLVSGVLLAVTSTYYYNKNKQLEQELFEKLLQNTYLKKSVSSIIESLNPRFSEIEIKIEKGDSLNLILNKLNIAEKERKKVLKSLLKNKNLSRLNFNETLYFKIDEKNPRKILEIIYSVSKTKDIYFIRNLENEKFESFEIEKKLTKKIVYKEAIIKNSLYKSATEVGIKPNIIIDFARIYGFQVDFQRDIWKNDSFQIIYENFLNENLEIVETGKILYANLILRGKEIPLYHYKNSKIDDHFDESGRSVKKTLMKTPINGARLSSPFGMRKHPILGFNKMHRGTDFAAPVGTPIMASGDGIVIKAGWCGGGGNCVKIKHNTVYQTVYAHMHKFGRGIKRGRRVKQGQIIGYVGSTGMSTGPHLHYEVIENGKKINSQKLKLPSGKILKGKERKDFEIVRIKTNVLKSELISKL